MVFYHIELFRTRKQKSLFFLTLLKAGIVNEVNIEASGLHIGLLRGCHSYVLPICPMCLPAGLPASPRGEQA